MQSTTETTLTELVHEAANPLTGAAQDYDPLIERIGAARFVLLGEASHGTHDFYHERAQITERLIKEKGFTAVAVEGRLARRLPRQPLRAWHERRCLWHRSARRFPTLSHLDVAQHRRS